MAASLVSALALALFLLSDLASLHASVIMEDGYEVATVIDGHKLHVNPHSVLHQSGSSDLIILDSASSAFYTVSFPLSQESVVKRLSGDGVVGYTDGESVSARFRNPRSFALDLKGNVYVADRKNHAIRKISSSGVRTIAGGYSQTAGHEDGPGKNATFSDDFEISFVAEKCALLVSDHGNQLVRQINLKAEDCSSGSQSATGAVSIWTLGVGLSVLLSFIVGIAVRPYIIPHEVSSYLYLNETWKQCLMSLRREILILCFDMRSAIASYSSSLYPLLKRLFWMILSHLSLLYGINTVNSPITRRESLSLIDSDALTSYEITKPNMYDDQLTDLITFDGSLDLLNVADISFEQGDDKKEESDVSFDRHGRIDDEIQANIVGFAVADKEAIPIECLVASSGLVKRR